MKKIDIIGLTSGTCIVVGVFSMGFGAMTVADRISNHCKERGFEGWSSDGGCFKTELKEICKNEAEYIYENTFSENKSWLIRKK